MSLPTRILRLSVPVFLVSAALFGQTPTPTPTPVPTPVATTVTVNTWSTENDHAVTGVSIQEEADGSVWFSIPSNDRLVQLQPDGTTFKQWQIRDDKNLGANPVQFQIDGTDIWIIENGESQIDAGFSAIGRLDTTTGALREWVIPGSKPAGLYRSPDGNTLWIPQTNGRLQSVDLNSLAVTDYRSTKTFAYSDMVVGADGALWLIDFGDNRIVRWVLGAPQETSWTISDPANGRLNSSQLRFDGAGMLWISELSANRVDRFDPATGQVLAYNGFINPIHFDFFDGRVFVTEAAGDNGRVVALDPPLAFAFGTTLVPETLDVNSQPNARVATIRDSTAIVSTFTSTRTTAAVSDVKVTADAAGIVRTQFPVTNAYGITTTGLGSWVGSNSKLVHILPQTLGTAGDLSIPLAAQFGLSSGFRIKVETTLVNRGTAAVSGDALFLYSPGAFSPSTTFTVGPGQTLVIPDTFSNSSRGDAVEFGPVRLRITGGAASDLLGSIRSARIRADGTSFGFSMPVLAPADVPGQGANFTVFLGNRASEISTFGMFSTVGGDATAALVAPDGTVRGTRRFTLAVNGVQEFNPAASGFGAAPEAGDIVRVAVASGSMEAYATVLDTGSGDVATSLPTATSSEGVFPNLSNFAGSAGRLSDLFVSNPDPSRPVNISFTFIADGNASAPRLFTVTIPAGGSRVIENSLSNFFAVLTGGAVTYTADGPLAVAARVASRRDEGDYATYFAAMSPSQAIVPGGAALSVGAPQTDTRQTDLLLFNGGQAGDVTVIALDSSGTETGRQTVSMGAQATLRLPAVLAGLGGSGSVAARLRVETPPGTSIHAATEQIDLGTGDVEIARLR